MNYFYTPVGRGRWSRIVARARSRISTRWQAKFTKSAIAIQILIQLDLGQPRPADIGIRVRLKNRDASWRQHVIDVDRNRALESGFVRWPGRISVCRACCTFLRRERDAAECARLQNVALRLHQIQCELSSGCVANCERRERQRRNDA